MNDKELIEYWKKRFYLEKQQKFDLLDQIESIENKLLEINNWNEFKDYVNELNK